MNIAEVERAAYIAAHRILTTNTSAPELACPGSRRSYAIDAIAGIIKDAFEVFSDKPDLGRADEVERTAEFRPNVALRSRSGTVLKLPQRAS